MTSKPPTTSVPSATVHTLPTLPGQADLLLRELEWKVCLLYTSELPTILLV